MANVRGWWDLNMVGTEDHPSGNTARGGYRITSFEVSQTDLEHIAELIKEGFTSGEIVRDEKEEDA